jgi:integrase
MGMPKIRISKSNVDLVQPGDLDKMFWDDKLAGFGLKVTPTGRKVYLYRYRIFSPGTASVTPMVTFTIGTHGNLTPDQARERAKELAAKVSVGIDPKVEQNKAKRDAEEKANLEVNLSFSRRADLWLEDYEHAKGRRLSSVLQAKSVMRRHLKPALKDKPLPNIGRADIQSVIDAVPVRQKAMRRAVFAYASVLFGWAANRGDIIRNPLSDMAKPESPDARDRILGDQELALIWQASKAIAPQFGAFYRLLILTGQRRDEVASLRWSELDRKSAMWTIPAERAKNAKTHLVPLSEKSIEQLDLVSGSKEIWPQTGYVLTSTGKNPISGFSKSKIAIDGRITSARGGEPLESWRVHDLRRTLATGLQRLGVRFEVTEAVLNHISGAKGGVAGIYQRHDWKEEKRAALAAWSTHVERILEGPDRSNVIQLSEAR